MEQGIKYDQDKPRMDLLDPTFTEGVARVLTFGAKKYAADNWRGGIKYSRTIAAIHRHLAAIQRGEDVDPESGEPHIYHIGCNVQFLGWMMQNKPDMDDRWKPDNFDISGMFALENNNEYR
jgi:hypothetical protein